MASRPWLRLGSTVGQSSFPEAAPPPPASFSGAIRPAFGRGIGFMSAHVNQPSSSPLAAPQPSSSSPITAQPQPSPPLEAPLVPSSSTIAAPPQPSSPREAPFVPSSSLMVGPPAQSLSREVSPAPSSPFRDFAPAPYSSQIVSLRPPSPPRVVPPAPSSPPEDGLVPASPPILDQPVPSLSSTISPAPQSPPPDDAQAPSSPPTVLPPGEVAALPPFLPLRTKSPPSRGSSSPISQSPPLSSSPPHAKSPFFSPSPPRSTSPPQPPPTEVVPPSLSAQPPSPITADFSNPASKIPTLLVPPSATSPQKLDFSLAKLIGTTNSRSSNEGRASTPEDAPPRMILPSSKLGDEISNVISEVPEQRIVPMQETVNQPGFFKDREQESSNGSYDLKKKDNTERSVKKKMKRIDSATSDCGDGSGIRIISIAGENRGAIMELGSSVPRSRNGGLMRTMKKISDEEGKGKAEHQEPNKEGKAEEMLRIRRSSFVNSNVQGINNSIVFDSSCSYKNPGVHIKVAAKATSS